MEFYMESSNERGLLVKENDVRWRRRKRIGEREHNAREMNECEDGKGQGRLEE